MAIPHITPEQVAQYGVVASPDRLTGKPADNKAIFDRLVRELVTVAVNHVIDQTNLLLISEDKRTQQEISRVNVETLRVTAEQLRVTAETARAEAEQARQTAETARTGAEKNRDNAETTRKTAQDAWVKAEAARVAAEVLRVEAEKARVSAETARDSAEASRGQAETDRKSAEAARATAETVRQTAEQGRSTDETARKNAESLRGTAEQGRVTAETGRTTAETARDTAEKTRVTAETGRSDGEKDRNAAESARKSAEDGRIKRDAADSLCEPYDPLRDYVTGNKAVQNGSTYRCTAPCRGIAPPDSAKWLLVAAKGMDGQGSGDMLAGTYDPTGKGMDIFAFAETKKTEAIAAAAADATSKADAAREAAKNASVPLAQKGAAGGVAPLGADGMIPLQHIPDEAKEQRVVANIAARDAIGKKFVGLSVYVKDATADPSVKRGGAYYLWDGAWNKTAEAESMDLSLTWDNVAGKPSSFPPSGHSHSPASVGIAYGVCSTSGGAKAVSVPGFQLAAGAIAIIKFSYGVPDNATLNINGTGAYPIRWMGNAIEGGGILAGDTCEFVYTGSSCNLLVIDRIASVGGVMSVSFAADSWATIQKMCSNGTYKKCYSIGDTKSILLSTGEKITVRIEDFDHDDLDSGGKAPLSIAFVDAMDIAQKMSSSEGNYGGWNATSYKAWLSTLLSQFPSDLQPLIKTVNKKSSAGSQSSSIVTTKDKLWPFSYTEVGYLQDASYSPGGEGTPYPLFISDASRIKKFKGSNTRWWLRSPYLGNTLYFCFVESSGAQNCGAVSFLMGACVGFCI